MKVKTSPGIVSALDENCDPCVKDLEEVFN